MRRHFKDVDHYFSTVCTKVMHFPSIIIHAFSWLHSESLCTVHAVYTHRIHSDHCPVEEEDNEQ